jgi:hypothetical protein
MELSTYNYTCYLNPACFPYPFSRKRINCTIMRPPLRPATRHHRPGLCPLLLLLLWWRLLVRRRCLGGGVEIIEVEQCDGGGENLTQ